MGPVVRLEILVHQEQKAEKVPVVIKDSKALKEIKELQGLLVTLDIVSVIR